MMPRQKKYSKLPCLYLKDFDYYLPSKLIVQKPIRPRDHSRLLLLNRKTGAIEHKHFYDLIDYLRPGDLLVLNNSKVFPARLVGRKAATGGTVEIFLHRRLSGEEANQDKAVYVAKTARDKKGGNIWECLIGGRVKEGLTIEFPTSFKLSGLKSVGLKSAGPESIEFKSTGLEAVILQNNHDGTWQVRFNLQGDRFWKVINKIGLVPLPPYIKRDKKMTSDKNNYQTVFADPHKVGSAAAPTAGLHFTKRLLKKIKAKGVKIVYVTLHVGLGTFAPIKTEKITEHKMHSEFVEISVWAAKEILAAKQAGRRVIAVGTTSCRTLESADWGKSAAQSFRTDIFIYPGYKFKIVDALITNFHLPKSTLLMLVSALAGKKRIDHAYQEAIKRRYRFFSYGDAMFI